MAILRSLSLCGVLAVNVFYRRRVGLSQQCTIARGLSYGNCDPQSHNRTTNPNPTFDTDLKHRKRKNLRISNHIAMIYSYLSPSRWISFSILTKTENGKKARLSLIYKKQNEEAKTHNPLSLHEESTWQVLGPRGSRRSLDIGLPFDS